MSFQKLYKKNSYLIIGALTLTCLILFPYQSQSQTRSQVKAQQIQTASLQDGLRAFYAGDYDTALRIFLKRAHNEDAESQYYLAYMYDIGNGVAKDRNEAAKWYLRAAKQGYLPAELYVGYLFATGTGLTKDLEQAKAWYKKAAIKGDVTAQNNLGTLLRQEDTPQSLYKAAQWFLSAAQQNNANAQFNLASMYYTGKGIRQNHAEALNWYLKSATQGHAQAQNATAHIYYHGQGTEKDLSSAIQWYQKSAAQNFVPAQYRLGTIYESQARLGNIPDDKKQDYAQTSILWYSNALKNNHTLAAFKLADHYKSGFGVQKDIKKSIQLLQDLVKKDYAPARLKLAYYLENGDKFGIEKKPEQALNWYLDAAKRGNAQAMLEAGRMNFDGIGTSKSLIEAYKWFSLAVDYSDDNPALKENAIIARVDVSNTMSALELEQARNRVSQWTLKNATSSVN